MPSSRRKSFQRDRDATAPRRVGDRAAARSPGRNLALALGSVLMLVAAALAAPPLRALERADICMAIGLDVSGSMRPDEMRLQFDGLARALNNPRLLRAIRAGRQGITAVAVFTWSANRRIEVLVPWSGIATAKDAEQVAARLFAEPNLMGAGNTSLSLAIETGVALLQACPWYAERQLLNIAGDGASNVYPGPEEARDAANDLGIVINGLVIAGEEIGAFYHYRDAVVGPPGIGFVVLVDDYRDFSTGMLRKLLLEMAMVAD